MSGRGRGKRLWFDAGEASGTKSAKKQCSEKDEEDPEEYIPPTNPTQTNTNTEEFPNHSPHFTIPEFLHTHVPGPQFVEVPSVDLFRDRYVLLRKTLSQVETSTKYDKALEVMVKEKITTEIEMWKPNT